MFDTELQRRAVLCYWPKVIVPDGTLTIPDGLVLLGGYPFVTNNTNAKVIRFTFSIKSLFNKIIEITLRYRK